MRRGGERWGDAFWVVEYPDVLKWGIVSISMIVPLVLVAWNFMRDAIDSVLGSNKWGIVILLGLWLASLASWLGADYWSDGPHRYGLTFAVHMAVLLMVVTTINITQSVRLWPVSLRGLTGDFVLVVVTAGAIGSAIGYMFRDSSGFQQHVTTKTMEYRSVGLVMITSRYVVIYDRDHVVTIPVEDVTRIEGSRPARISEPPASHSDRLGLLPGWASAKVPDAALRLPGLAGARSPQCPPAMPLGQNTDRLANAKPIATP